MCAASGMSSKPTTATSSGTRRPASRSACMAPAADRSLWAKTASNCDAGGEQPLDRRPAALEGEVALDDQGRVERRPGVGVRRRRSRSSRSWVQPKRLRPGDHQRTAPAESSRCAPRRPRRRRGWWCATDGNAGRCPRSSMSTTGRPARVQVGDVVEGALRLDHQQAVERLRGDLGGELPHRLLAPVAGEQQQAVPLGLHHVDRALQHLAHPGPGQRRAPACRRPGSGRGPARPPGRSARSPSSSITCPDPGRGGRRPARPCR